MKRILLPLLCTHVFCSFAFAIECPDDEKLIRITGDKIGYNMYNNTAYANKASCKTCGEWKLTNKDTPKDLNIIGRAVCLDSDVFNEHSESGSFCHCKIQEIDNYKVLSDWNDMKHYQRHVFDEDKKYSSETAKRSQKKYIDDKNNQDCMDNCTQKCLQNLSKLMKTIHGYYVCDKALYKAANVLCTAGKRFIRAKTIQVFNDIAEIDMEDDYIVFTRDSSNTQDFIYMGKYEYEPVYLKIQNNSVYVGNKLYSMEECM